MSRRSAAAAVVSDPPPVPVPLGEYRELALASVIESPLNPRTHFDPASIAELAASVRQHGVLHAVVVRASAHEPGAYEVVAGARRVRAARQAGLTVIPAVLREVSDAQLLELALQENLHRQSMTPLDEARALTALASLDAIYRDDRVLASKIGRSETYVRDRRKLLTLDPDVVAALEADAITAKHAERIARLPADIHRLALEACFRPGLIDVDQATDSDRLLTLAGCIDARKWPALAPALTTLRDFDRWVEAHAKVDVLDPDVQQQLLDQGEPLDGETTEGDVAAALASILQLSEDATTTEARALQVIPPSAYRVITKVKDRCDFARKGAIVHPPPVLDEVVRLVDVCTERRRCRKHWPAVAAAAKGQGAEARAKEAEQRARAEQARKDEEAAWKRDQVIACRAVGAFAAKQKLSLVTALTDYFGPIQVKRVAADFGAPLTDKTAAAFLRLRAIPTWSRAGFVDSVKGQFGAAGVKAVTAALAAATQPAAPAKKPTAKKGGRK